jgi:hypothetical protein
MRRRLLNAPAKLFHACKIAVALPIYQIANLVAYANTRQSWSAKIATVTAFLPIIAITTICWGAAWTAAVWLLLRLMTSR